MPNADRLATLAEFPFRRLAALLAGVEPGQGGAPAADLSIGEPKHAPPPLLAETVAANAHLWNRYPPVGGTPEFRAAVAGWLERRFGLPGGAVDPERNVLPLAGTKEGLFLLPAALPPAAAGRGDGRPPAVLMPNPVYAVYYGAAVMAGCEPVLMPAARETGFLPDLDALPADLLARTALLHLCSPANPQGAIADGAYLDRAVALAREHGFVLAVDECYSEIFDREPPPGALEAALRDGGDFRNVLDFNSLSKRSSAAGLRSGFVAGDPALLARLMRLRAYAAAVQPLPLMAAAAALWRDEGHVAESQARYRAKIDAAEQALEGRLGFYRPAGGFFLWLNVGDGEAASLRLWREAGIKTLPGAYLGAAPDGSPNPGDPYLRVALLDEPEQLTRSLARLAAVLTTSSSSAAAA